MSWGEKSAGSSIVEPTKLSWRLLSIFALIACLLFFTGCATNSTGNTGSHVDNAQSIEDTSSDATSTKAVPTTGIQAKKIDEQSVAQNESKASDNATSALSDDNQTPNAEELIVRFIDVGQGDCTLITCNGSSMLIDGGPSSSSSKIYTILKDLRLSHLNAIVVTHPDADHCGGVSGALSFASFDVCYCSTETSNTDSFANLTKQLTKQGKSIVIPALGDTFELGGAICTFVGPVHTMEDDNNNSLVLRLEYKGTSFLFAADAETEAEQAMLSRGTLQQTDVLKVGHHGSSSSCNPVFLNTVKPRYAVISVGENNYGHPAPVVLNRLAALPCTVLRTDEVGTISIKSDGENLSIETTEGELHE